MTKEQFLKNLSVPKGKIDVILDTDAYNEIDDQFAISYLLKNREKLNTVGLVAAPFFNSRATSVKEGMEKSYNEIKKLLELGDFGVEVPVFKGSDRFMTSETDFVPSEGCDFIVDTAMRYSPENPLYVVAIGAITDVASALLKKPEIKENIVVVWLGGHSYEYKDTKEFNMIQDVPSARVVMGSGAPFVQLPCTGVVSELRVSEQDLKFWIYGKNKLSTYLAENAMNEANSYAKGKPWTRVIWDVSAISWLLNEDERYMESRIVNVKLPNLEGYYEQGTIDIPMCYVYSLKRDNIIDDLFKVLAK